MRFVPVQWLAAVVVVSIMLGVATWYWLRYVYFRLWRSYSIRESLVLAYGLDV